VKLTVFYVTYRKDLCWIVYSAQLLHKHFRAAFDTVICAEEDCRDVCETWGLPRTTYHYTKPWPDGYAFAMYQKTMADQFTDADLICLMDSDHILLEPAYLEDFMDHGKPIIRYRDWDEDPNDPSLIIGQQQWAPPTERVMGSSLDKDYMVGAPFIFWRDTFLGVRNRVEEVTGLPFHDAVYSDRPYVYTNFLNHPKVYCDFESLGLYGAKFQADRYHLVHHPRGLHWPFRTYWSHGDWTPSLQARFDGLLAAKT
jgi:hypothetical protein